MNDLWRTDKISPTLTYIMRGDIVAGTIAQDDSDTWHVEILWNVNDIKFASASYDAALAFVLGVEKTFAAMRETECPNIAPQ